MTYLLKQLSICFSQQADRIAELEKLVSDMIYEKSSGVYDKPQTNAEPVAYTDHVNGKPKLIDGYVVATPYDIPLVRNTRPKPLSDEEIIKLFWDASWGTDEDVVKFARAIERILK